jgi:phosphotriesterase-related protein
MVDELRDGVKLVGASDTSQDWQAEVRSTGIRAGVIKAAATYPLAPAEERVLRGAAIAQRETGAGITVHVGRDERSALEIVGVLDDAGADLTRASMDHLELRVERMETLLEIAATGCFLEFDMFGHESSYYPLTKRDMPSDAQRLDVIGELVENGLLDRILVSHDICTKHRLLRYGGHGYEHVVTNIVPRMRERGFSEGDVDAILVRNPARLLAGERVDG